MWDFREIWTKMAQHVEFFSIKQCGHLPQEEKPAEVNAELLRFLDPWRQAFGARGTLTCKPVSGRHRPPFGSVPPGGP